MQYLNLVITCWRYWTKPTRSGALNWLVTIPRGATEQVWWGRKGSWQIKSIQATGTITYERWIINEGTVYLFKTWVNFKTQLWLTKGNGWSNKWLNSTAENDVRFAVFIVTLALLLLDKNCLLRKDILHKIHCKIAK